jgi:hypothetical protein
MHSAVHLGPPYASDGGKNEASSAKVRYLVGFVGSGLERICKVGGIARCGDLVPIMKVDGDSAVSEVCGVLKCLEE